MTHDNDIIERLGALFSEQFHIEVPSPDTDLLDSGILDSFQFVELLLQLEQNFNLHFKLDSIDLEDLRTITRISRLVQINTETSHAQAFAPVRLVAD